MSLILASNSQIRKTMFEQAGLVFEVRSPDFDEGSAKNSGLEGEQLVRALAEGKAGSGGATHGRSAGCPSTSASTRPPSRSGTST